MGLIFDGFSVMLSRSLAGLYLRDFTSASIRTVSITQHNLVAGSPEFDNRPRAEHISVASRVPGTGAPR